AMDGLGWRRGIGETAAEAFGGGGGWRRRGRQDPAAAASADRPDHGRRQHARRRSALGRPARQPRLPDRSLMMSTIASFGIWNWFIAGGILLAVEVLAPGTFMLWLPPPAVFVGGLFLPRGWRLP